MKDRRTFLKLAALGVASTTRSWLSCTEEGVGDSPREHPSAQASADFFAAVSRGDLATVRRLLGNTPALLRQQDAEGRTPFACALLAAKPSVAGYLRDQGYEPDLHESILARDWKRLAQLESEHRANGTGDSWVAHVNHTHPIGGSAMFAAAAAGAGADIWRVYALCGDPNKAQPAAVTPLQKALRYADLARAEMTAATLLANAADPNPPKNGDSSPLHIAVERGSSELVEMLIRRGAAVDHRDSQGRTPLDLAETLKHEHLLPMLRHHRLIARTCTTSKRAYDVHGSPYVSADISDIPLAERSSFVGRSHGNLQGVKEALNREPRLVHSVATTDEICVEACAHTGQLAIVDSLLESGAPYSLPTAIMRGDLKSARRLLDQDPQRIHERGAHDFPLLWYPVIGACDLEVTRFLIERGAQVEEQHYLGTTALHWACLRGRLEDVEYWLDHGANVHRRGRKFDAAGETPLDCARRARQGKVVQLLESRKGAR